jgi:adenylosuccinate synthase
MSAVAILGAQWGDEGKGKVVDFLAGTADLVVRFQGGPNAGHTVEAAPPGDSREPVHLVLHHVPSGLLHEGTRALMGAGMVVDPDTLKGEIARLEQIGVRVTPERLHLALDAHIILPVHRAVDRAREETGLGGKIGTTLRGIGPAYEDRASRRGIRFRDVLDADLLRRRLGRLLFERNALLEAYDAEERFDLDETADLLRQRCQPLEPYLCESQPLLQASLQAGDRVLIEGAQGALLDLTLGTYPFVTSSHTTTGGISVGIGLAPSRLDAVVGVTKAYTTRVGGGPFPSELEGPEGQHLARVGHEFGATTGRPRRCGWLDLVALRYAHQCCGFSALALTKLDVPAGLERVGICTAYRIDGEQTDVFPHAPHRIEGAEPVLEYHAGWEWPDQPPTTPDALPQPALAFVDRVAELMGVPVDIISVGPQRQETIVRGPSVWEGRAKPQS